PENDAGERARQEDDQQRAIADEVDAVEERSQLERRRDEGREGFRQEGPEAPEGVDDSDGPAADGVEGAQRRDERPFRHARGDKFPGPRAESTGRTGGTSGRRPAGSRSRSRARPARSRHPAAGAGA